MKNFISSNGHFIGMVIQAFNSSIKEAETGGTL